MSALPANACESDHGRIVKYSAYRVPEWALLQAADLLFILILAPWEMEKKYNLFSVNPDPNALFYRSV